MLKLLLLACAIFCVALGLPFTLKATIPNLKDGIEFIEFCEDQSFLVAINNKQQKVMVYNGFTLALLQTISTTLNSTGDPRFAAFSHNNQLLAIGDTAGLVQIYGRNADKFQTTPKKVVNETGTKGITAVLFSKDNSYMVIGDTDGKINFITSDKFEVKFAAVDFPTTVLSLAFGPKTGNLLVGGGRNGIEGKLTLFGPASNFTNVVHDFTLLTDDEVYGVAISSDEALILATNNGTIKVWNAGDYSLYPDLTTTLNVLYEVAITSNSLYVAGAGNTQVRYWTRPNIQTAFTPAAAPIPSSLQNIALSIDGGDLIVVTQSGTVQTINQYTLCVNGTFYASTDVCTPCDPSCTACYNSATKCFGCSPKFFLDGLACKACQRGCNICVSAANCSQCNTAANWINVDGVCECNSRFFEKDNVCQPCMVGCLTCTASATCEECDIANNFVNVNKVCQCVAKYRLDNLKCVPCGLGCNKCDVTGCLECDAVQHFVINPGQQDCVCDDANNWELNAGECVCKRGFFDSKNGTCDTCKIECSACESLTNCTACVVPLMILDDGVCSCPKGTFFDSLTPACVACTVPFCLDCTAANQCVECNGAQNRQPSDDLTTCVCIRGFYDNAGVCAPCGIPGCERCNSPTECTLCNRATHWVENGAGGCQCETRYLNVAGTCTHCINRGCLNCAPTTAQCTECDIQRKWHEQGIDCQCDDGFYDDKIISCLLCETGCLRCLDQHECTECYTAGNYELKDGDCICKSHYYPFNQTQCLECSLEGCFQCSAANLCTECYPTFVKEGDKCVCVPEKYPDGTQCVDCVEPCKTCSTKTKCDSCIDGYSKNDNNQCIGDGLSPLIIVLIVVGGLAVIGAAFAVIKYCKKKRSPLEQEGEYEPVE